MLDQRQQRGGGQNQWNTVQSNRNTPKNSFSSSSNKSSRFAAQKKDMVSCILNEYYKLKQLLEDISQIYVAW